MEVVLCFVEVPIADEYLQVLEFRGKELRPERVRVVAERIGKEDEFAGESLYCGAAKASVKMVDDYPSARSGSIFAAIGLDFQSVVIGRVSLCRIHSSR